MHATCEEAGTRWGCGARVGRTGGGHGLLLPISLLLRLSALVLLCPCAALLLRFSVLVLLCCSCASLSLRFVWAALIDASRIDTPSKTHLLHTGPPVRNCVSLTPSRHNPSTFGVDTFFLPKHPRSCGAKHSSVEEQPSRIQFQEQQQRQKLKTHSNGSNSTSSVPSYPRSSTMSTRKFGCFFVRPASTFPSAASSTTTSNTATTAFILLPALLLLPLFLLQKRKVLNQYRFKCRVVPMNAMTHFCFALLCFRASNPKAVQPTTSFIFNLLRLSAPRCPITPNSSTFLHCTYSKTKDPPLCFFFFGF